MENTNEENLRKNLWQQRCNGNDDNQPYFTPPYQPMQHPGFDLQRELNQAAPVPPSVPENMQFSYDNNGPYLKIYFNENNMQSNHNDYELFADRNETSFNFNRDGFLPNTQNQMPFQSMGAHHSQPNVPNVIHHLVSSLGPNKTGSYSPFGESIINNNPASVFNAAQQCQTQLPPTQATTLPPMPLLMDQLNNHSVIGNMNNDIPEMSNVRASDESSKPPATSSNVSSANVKKTRIVAEVKPMRMSYSDVVSKNAVNEQSPVVGGTNSASSSPNTTLPVTTKSVKTDGKAKHGTFDSAKSKKSPINTSGTSIASTEPRKAPSSKPSVPNQQANVKRQTSNVAGKDNVKRGPTSAPRNQYARDGSEESDDEDKSTTIGSDDEDDDDVDENDDEDIDDDHMEYYVHKNVYHGDTHNIEKITTKSGYKKTKPSVPSPVASRKAEKVQKRSSKPTIRKRQKYEFLRKFFIAWGEYLWKFLLWLYSLIYDVSYLSCGIIWDRMNWCYQCALQGLNYVRQEMHGNPFKVGWEWTKNTWKRVDGKFDKKSKWAFWRWMFKKKQPPNEQTKDYYKDGKLPKTAEEAMKSLLNCKGKDAYSILGVGPSCSQEQIRKHYKKIAVLVHPDKNKMAGAEEAFKVLQRSFELIGEPENRQKYDQSMAEALHAEKAFSELNDLLVQLQTKISEAANTIRCSSCSFRHPRKPTGRKPFAARECATCKIRHPAREGDIWAETYFMGFRWKYLALMESNVYDITEWALCQRGALSHLQANSCVVQYKIVLGGNQQQHDREKFKKEAPAMSEPNMDDFSFLNSIYAGQHPGQPTGQHVNPPRRRYKKN